jgi:hypothetical protein
LSFFSILWISRATECIVTLIFAIDFFSSPI